jgi:hypothetical protein
LIAYNPASPDLNNTEYEPGDLGNCLNLPLTRMISAIAILIDMRISVITIDPFAPVDRADIISSDVMPRLMNAFQI